MKKTSSVILLIKWIISEVQLTHSISNLFVMDPYTCIDSITIKKDIRRQSFEYIYKRNDNLSKKSLVLYKQNKSYLQPSRQYIIMSKN